MIILIGIVLAIFWYLNAKSSYEWVKNYRKKLIEIDEEINPYKSFSESENIGNKSKYYLAFRPSVITNILPIIFIIIWALLGFEVILR